MTAETMKCTVLHIQSNNADTFAVLHNEVKSEIFNEKVGVMAKGLAIKSMEESMTSTIGSGSAAIGLTTLAIFEGLTTKGALIDLALLCP